MKKLHLAKLVAASLGAALLAQSASAAETITSTATMTVQNAFDLTETAAMNFGTITAVQTLTILDLGADNALGGAAGDADVTLVATFTGASTATTGGVRIKPDGTTNEIINGDISGATLNLVGGGADPVNSNDTSGFSSSVREIVPGTPASFSISNAAAFTVLTVTDPVDTVTLVRGGAPASESFTLDIDLDDMFIVGGGRDGSLVSANQPQTDASGAVALVVGGELRINPLFAGGALGDGVYTGNYEIEVSY